ncbi:hypothetical protein [Paraburkholderia hospita]|uniref:hypothetical protein n=1 Tax=Paraburkholderia hospita TaxID=169430 RepID=UPI000B342521|nr:hypothetical protein [Paraburkholderia hospita]OUL79067.1 hypothetical protein CA603_33795 [Paraburkholderia hospita]
MNDDVVAKIYGRWIEWFQSADKVKVGVEYGRLAALDNATIVDLSAASLVVRGPFYPETRRSVVDAMDGREGVPTAARADIQGCGGANGKRATLSCLTNRDT